MTRIALIVGAVLLAGAMALSASTGEATGYTVTKTADTFDGVCDADCSLREAIWAANNSQGPHTINIPGGGNVYTLTIPGGNEDASQTGDLDINTEVEIFGDENPIIQMSSTITDRVFHVHGGPVTIDGVTIRGGSSAEGGGIRNLAQLTLGQSTVTANLATDGGGIYSTGPLTITYSTVIANGANRGGGLFSSGPLSIVTSTVSDNTAGYGAGGIHMEGPTSYLATVTVSNNTGHVYAGGLYYNGGNHQLLSSTVSGNSNVTNESGGGGIYVHNSGYLSITTSTISGNHTPGGYGGGGISNVFSSVAIDRSSLYANSAPYGGALADGFGATTTITNSTLSGNASSGVGGGIGHGDGALTVTNSTFSGNTATTFGAAIYKSGGTAVFGHNIIANSLASGNCDGAVASSGFNISSDSTCTLAAIADRINTPVPLGPLALNGGTTHSHALPDGSIAADSGGFGCPPTDQRGIARPQGARCDIGAYEAPDSESDGASDPLDSDDDNDGIPDANETPSCRTLAEDFDGWQDPDGCPDPDNDGDTLCDHGMTSPSCTGSDLGKTCFDPAGTLSCPTIECRNAAEDVDAFKDTDGCPEPDNDNDGKLDAADVCPGTGSLAGANGMLGSPQDLNHNGIRDGAEAAFTSDDSTLTFEDYDGVLDGDGCHDSPGNDFDGDGLTDDTEVFTLATDPGNPDSDADAITDGTDNCPNWANASQNVPPWAIPANDSDCDGWNKTREQHVGSDPTKHCNGTSALNDEPDAWPTDFNDSRFTNLSDVSSFNPTYNKFPGDAGYSQRHDLNASNGVTLSDVSLMNAFYNKGCG